MENIPTKPNEKHVYLYRLRQPLKEEQPETYPLDHNHTHFLMLKDPFGNNDIDWRSQRDVDFRADLVLNLRTQIEEESQKISNQGQIIIEINYQYFNLILFFLDSRIPIIQILVEGGITAILTVCKSIERNKPVIIIDVIKYFCLHMSIYNTKRSLIIFIS